MINLDSIEEIKKLDNNKILESIHALPLQFSDTWEEVGKIELPDGYSSASNVIICGMGGSALGGRIVDSLTYERARVPIEIYTEYKIPNYAGTNTFVILSSYSGDTEETLSAFNEAKKANAKIFGITSGGRLLELLKDNKLPYFLINTKFNPSGQPRMGLGYSIAAILRILSKYAFIRFSDEEQELKYTIKHFAEDYDASVKETNNPAKALARELMGNLPIIFASEHLVGSSHAFSNQINENAKTFSAIFDIPEANHHLLEGLKFPSKARDMLKFLFIESGKYSPQVLKRYAITKDVLEKNGYSYLTYKTISEDKYCEIFEVLVFGSYLSFYLALLNGIDPGLIPTVDYFKAKLSSSS